MTITTMTSISVKARFKWPRFGLENFAWNLLASRLCLALELCELVQVLCGLNRGLEEGTLLATAEGETLENLVEANLGWLVDGQKELAELALEVVCTAEELVDAVLVGLQVGLA